MAIRNIVKEGDPILNKVCRPVTNFDDRLATLLDDMHCIGCRDGRTGRWNAGVRNCTRAGESGSRT